MRCEEPAGAWATRMDVRQARPQKQGIAAAGPPRPFPVLEKGRRERGWKERRKEGREGGREKGRG